MKAWSKMQALALDYGQMLLNRTEHFLGYHIGAWQYRAELNEASPQLKTQVRSSLL